MTTSTAPVRGRAGRPAPRRPSAAFWLLLIGWLLFLSLVAGVVVGLVQIYNSGRILAGVEVMGRSLSGRTAADAAARLDDEWRGRRVMLDAAQADGTIRTWTLSPVQVGALLDAQATAEQAYRVGREELRPENIGALGWRLLASTDLLPIRMEPTVIAPVWRFDSPAAAGTLRMLANELETPMENAGVRVVDGRIETTPALTGRSLDIAAALAALEAYPWGAALAQPGDALHFALPIVEHPAAITDVSALVAELSPLLSQPIAIRLYDAVRDERAEWTAQPADMGRWLAFEAATPAEGDEAAASRLTWSVDEARVAEWLAEQSATFGDERFVAAGDAAPLLAEAFAARRPAISTRISHGEREHVVQPGETLSSIAFDYGIPYPYIQALNPETAEGLFAGETIRIPSQDVMLPLPAVENKRIIISLSKQTVKVYENGQIKWDWVGSTGLPDSPTAPGVFQVQSHEEMAYAANWDLYMPWFMGIYRPVPGQEFMNGFHGFPSRDRRQLLWTSNLGRPVTYGCILLSTDNAKLLYDWAEVGVVVEILK
ncbi:MAG: L,D-transpeptidase catalytic domain [Chloroflexi bacterium ADurb.Bin325]|nr:MAG: L,D-transpeptidase catalytic domain [Chloroflexi bacterium ADurb.Bin325]